ncbi:secA translation cis-regulator SecM [Lonepinella sp. BR2474]|uniref:secA translation cis-regulator SecM n=1 Tax=unclassified Lonepinella TaxID=2642006 RepID=UPI003F6DBA4A
MTLTKGKHNFWSQLLVSMIAIFALPDVQVVERSADYPPAYQNQSMQQQVLRAIYQSQQEIQPANYPPAHGVMAIKQAEFQPHFVAAILAEHAPIRGSPLA